MGILQHLLLGICFGLHFQIALTWENDWDGRLWFTCRSNQAIDQIFSSHSDRYEDRRYSFHCGDAASNRGVSYSCAWSAYVNEFDRLLHYQCPGVQYINGMASYHDNHHEDRRHKFRCCGPVGSAYYFTNCYWTGWVNNYDWAMTYYVPNGYVLRGVSSEHHNHYEDRKFKFEVCQLYQR